MTPPDISVVLVGYNSVAFIDRCIASIRLSAETTAAEIVLVDNASIDGTADHVRLRWPDVKVHDAGWNSGFSRACNTGAEIASGRHIMLLNGDAALDFGAIDSIVGFLDRVPGGTVAAPRILNADGSDQGTARAFPKPSAAIWGRRSPLRKFFPNNRFTAAYLSGINPGTNDPFEVDWVSGACLAVNRATYLRLGGLDEDFFMYWEDADFCHRVKDQGGRVYCLPTCTVVHDEGGSAGVTAPTQNRRFHASAYRYSSKHLFTGKRAAARPLAAAALTARALGVAALRQRSQSNDHATTHAGT